MSPRQFRKFLEKIGFTEVQDASEDWQTLKEEVAKILEKNGLPESRYDTKSKVRTNTWDSPQFLEAKSSIDYCLETVVDRRVYVFEELFCDGKNLALALINAKQLTEILECRTFREDFWIYVPGRAVMIHAWESQNYDRVSPICAKVFKARVKSALVEESQP